MSTLVTINSNDLISNSRTDVNSNFTALNNEKIETSYLDTDTTLAANSDSKIATQKAVKTYIDTSGGQNASTTLRGIVEEATSAEMIAGTATGGTGARLFLNPTLVAEIGTDKIVKTKSTGLLDTSIVPGYVATPSFYQSLSVEKPTGYTTVGFGSNQTGSVAYLVNNGATLSLMRFARDAITGTYEQTHSVNMTLNTPDCSALIVIGVYLYVFTNDGANIVCSRFLGADLTGEQVMTVPTVANTTGITAWTDGTFAYVISAQTSTTSRKWSVSGTTFSASSTTTCDSNLSGGSADLFSSIYDGTNVYVTSNNDILAPKIMKLTDINGAAITTTTKFLSTRDDNNGYKGFPIINIDSTKIYVGFLQSTYDETDVNASFLTLYPISKP